MRRFKLKLAVAVAALAAAIGGGVAFAAGTLSPEAESDAIVADAAKELGVTPAELEEALEGALQNRVDAAVADGRLTAEQAAELKGRIAAGDMPLLGMGHRGGHHGPGVDLATAAGFLGLTEADLRASLEEGDSLADLAKEQGKTRAGLVAALVASAREHLEEKAEARGLTDAQKASMLAGLTSRIEKAVDGEVRFHRGPMGRGGPPAADA